MKSNFNNLGNVLIRSDLNVPIVNGSITDDYRIYKSLEILEKINNNSKTITFSSHLGRPKKNNLDLTLEPVVQNKKYEE